jgi:hypothetical protein
MQSNLPWNEIHVYGHYILRTNSLLRHFIEGKMGRENEDEDISSYWMPLRKRKDTGNLEDEALERTPENSLSKRPGTCRKAGGLMIVRLLVGLIGQSM